MPLEIPGRRRTIEAWRERGGRVAAAFPVHYSRALLRAHGLLPVEVWGPPDADTSRADAHLQAYTCDIVRRGLGFLLGGGLDVCDCLLVPHACDSLQGLGSILLDFVKTRSRVLVFYPPRGEGEPALEFCAEELRRLDKELAEISGQGAAGEKLQRAIDVEQRADGLLADLWARRSSLPFSNLDFYRLCRTRCYLPAEQFSDLAGQAVGEKPGAAPAAPLVLSGILPEPMRLLSVLDRAGALVVADDTCLVGRRLYPAAGDADPYRREARRLLGAAPDSTRGSSLAERARHLLDLVTRHQACGVVFCQPPFCEPELFYLPELRRALGKEGIKSVVLEHEICGQLSGGVETRLEAFLEAL